MLRPHLGALDGVDRDSGRILRAMAAPGRGNQPVVMVGRDQDEFPPAMPRDLRRSPQAAENRKPCIVKALLAGPLRPYF